MPTGGTRRKRAQLTMSAKKPDHQSQVKTEEERAFAQMIPACAFDVLTEPDDQNPFSFGRTRFRKGDDVMLHSVHIDTADVWIGRILKIRTAPDHSDTLVKVGWYWSRNDVAKHAKTFDASQCAPLERILSDDYDYVSPYSFERVVYVHEYDETSLDPPLLTPDDLFVRAKFLHRKRVIKPALGADTCFCQQAYNPFPSLPLPMSAEDEMMTAPPQVDLDIMHFCPAAACRKWYHASCLLSRQAVLASLPAESQGAGQSLIDTLPPQTRGLRLLAVNPDEEVLFTTLEYFYEPESQQEIHCTDDLPLSEALELLSRSPAIIGHLPPGLLVVAQSPIIRFPNGPDEFAVGNVSDVVLARRLVYAVIQHSALAASKSWDPDILGLVRLPLHHRVQAAHSPYQTVEDSSVFEFFSWPTALEDKMPGSPGDHLQSPTTTTMSDGYDDMCMALLERLCEDASQFGLLASPLDSYWEEKAAEYRAMEGVFSGPALLCPKCRGAI